MFHISISELLNRKHRKDCEFNMHLEHALFSHLHNFQYFCVWTIKHFTRVVIRQIYKHVVEET